MRIPWPRSLTAVILACVPASAQQPEEVIAGFEKQWSDIGRAYMRPLDDDGWKARMKAFHQLAELGGKAVPALQSALNSENDETRIFAAQALTYLADKASADIVAKALEDSSAAVRVYAVDTLGLAGKLDEAKNLDQLAKSERNRDVRSHIGFAKDRDDAPPLRAIRESLAKFATERIDTAKLKEKAPDFTLKDPLGKEYTLSDFRGKKSVVLVFVYGDT